MESMPPKAPVHRCAAWCAGLLLWVAGCSTPFTAVPVDPLRTQPTAGWGPGELSQASQALIDARGWGDLWRARPAAAIRDLEPSAGEPTVRRALVELALAAGMDAQRQRSRSGHCDGFYLCAAEHASDLLLERDRTGSEESLRFCERAQEFALSRLVERHGTALWDSGSEAPSFVVGPTRRYQWVRQPATATASETVSWQRVVPADRFRVRDGPEISPSPGWGAACAGKVEAVARSAANPGRVGVAGLPPGTWVPLTTTLEFGPVAPMRTVVFRVHDRKRTETVDLSGRSLPLAADFATPFAIRTRELGRQNLLSLGLRGFLLGDRFSDDIGLHPLETPDTDRIPVVLVHGLLSEPNTWRFLHATLLADPEIRRRFQFLVFQYPSSTPVQWSSTRLRQSLAEWQRRMDPDGVHTNLHRMVLVGHSMGGLLSRLQIVEGGEDLYRRYFTRPVDQLRLGEPQRRLVRDMFFFEPNPRVEQVVFICVPHGGSPLATDWPGRFARYVARLPVTAFETTAGLMTFNPDALTLRGRLMPGSSIDSLRPGGDTARLLKELPMDPRVRVASIIGCQDECADPQEASDGVVPYRSSHLEGVPETLIPCGHSGQNHPLCAEQVRRLLLDHLRH